MTVTHHRPDGGSPYAGLLGELLSPGGGPPAYALLYRPHTAPGHIEVISGDTAVASCLDALPLGPRPATDLSAPVRPGAAAVQHAARYDVLAVVPCYPPLLVSAAGRVRAVGGERGWSGGLPGF